MLFLLCLLLWFISSSVRSVLTLSHSLHFAVVLYVAQHLLPLPDHVEVKLGEDWGEAKKDQCVTNRLSEFYVTLDGNSSINQVHSLPPFLTLTENFISYLFAMPQKLSIMSFVKVEFTASTETYFWLHLIQFSNGDDCRQSKCKNSGKWTQTDSYLLRFSQNGEKAHIWMLKRFRRVHSHVHKYMNTDCNSLEVQPQANNTWSESSECKKIFCYFLFSDEWKSFVCV